MADSWKKIAILALVLAPLGNVARAQEAPDGLPSPEQTFMGELIEPAQDDVQESGKDDTKLVFKKRLFRPWYQESLTFIEVEGRVSSPEQSLLCEGKQLKIGKKGEFTCLVPVLAPEENGERFAKTKLELISVDGKVHKIPLLLKVSEGGFWKRLFFRPLKFDVQASGQFNLISGTIYWAISPGLFYSPEFTHVWPARDGRLGFRLGGVVTRQVTGELMPVFSVMVTPSFRIKNRFYGGISAGGSYAIQANAATRTIIPVAGIEFGLRSSYLDSSDSSFMKPSGWLSVLKYVDRPFVRAEYCFSPLPIFQVSLGAGLDLLSKQ